MDWSFSRQREVGSVNAAGGPVGGNLLDALFARCGQARFLGALDLRHATVVNDELDDAETQAFDLFADQGNPLRQRSGRGKIGIGSGGSHEAQRSRWSNLRGFDEARRLPR